MLSLWQYWRGHFTSWELPGDSIFLKMAVRPGWNRKQLFRIGGHSIGFVYPLTVDAVRLMYGHLE